jgi:hypothetical protein
MKVQTSAIQSSLFGHAICFAPQVLYKNSSIKVVANTAQSEFGTHDSRGVAVDLGNLSKLDAASNKGGLNSGDALAHEAMDAYRSLSISDPDEADRAAAELYPALFSPDAARNKNDWGAGNTELRGTTRFQDITDGRGSERVTIRYITPIPAADLDSRFNTQQHIKDAFQDAGSRVTEVTFVPKKP